MKFVIPGLAFFVLGSAITTAVVFAQTEDSLENAIAAPLQQTKAPEHSVLGAVLFDHVTTVHFAGIDMPANTDGSFGGWNASHSATENGEVVQEWITIYENYIVKEMQMPDGMVFRESRPYDTLGRIEQRIPANAVKTEISH